MLLILTDIIVIGKLSLRRGSLPMIARFKHSLHIIIEGILLCQNSYLLKGKGKDSVLQ